jgi:uncharacterized OB-fold protein
VARDPVNQAMIRHWCDAMGDDNPVYTDPDAARRSTHGQIVAPPTMLQVWTMPGLRRREPAAGAGGGRQALMSSLASAGYTSIVATNCEQEYTRYLHLDDVVTVSTELESVSALKHTALGDGFFVTTLQSFTDQRAELVGTMRFRIFVYRPPANALRPSEPRPSQDRQSDAAAEAIPWPRPAVSRDTAFFWEGTRQGELRIQRCARCGRLRHPPGPGCPHCSSLDWDFIVSSGRGVIRSYVVHHHPPVPPFQTPFVVVLVDVAEGTRMVGNLLGVDRSQLRVGLDVAVSFEHIDDDLTLPQWRLRER